MPRYVDLHVHRCAEFSQFLFSQRHSLACTFAPAAMSTQDILTALDNTRSTILTAYNSLDDLRASFEELSKSTAKRLDKLQNSIFYADDSIRTLSTRTETLLVASNIFNFTSATVSISGLHAHETSPREGLQETVLRPGRAEEDSDLELHDLVCGFQIYIICKSYAFLSWLCTQLRGVKGREDRIVS